MDIMEKVITSLDEHHLNFDAKMAETYALVDGVYQPTGKYTPVRTDKTGADAIIDGTAFSTRFVPIQNRDAFRVIADMAVVSDLEFINVGSWGNGAGVYAQVSIGESMSIGNSGDKVGRYLSLVNSHDGSRALSVLVTPFRFFCQNQISKAIGEATRNGNIISIRHDALGEERIREAASAVSIADAIFHRSEEQYMRLADTRVSIEQVREAMARMLPWNGHTDGRGATIYSGRVSAMRDRFLDADGGRNDVYTGWNLYNAIQGTFQHDSKKTRTYEKSLLLGSIAEKSSEALRVVQDVIAHPYEKTVHAEFDAIFGKVA